MPVSRAKATGTQTQSGNGYMKFFRFYGVSLSPENRQLIGDCPFADCGKEGHFYANPATGQWDCKRCSRSGNTYTFIADFHKAWLDLTTKEDYAALLETRPGLSLKALTDNQLAFNGDLGEWILPAFSSEKKMVNLYVWRELYDDKQGETKHPVMSGPTFKQCLYGIHNIRADKTRPLWILEGHWDYLTWYGMLQELKLSATHDLIAVPGAGTFPRENLSILDGRDVRILFDNDKAGREGVNSLIKAMANHGTLPARFGVMEWPEGTENGYDVRDLRTVWSAAKSYNFAVKHLRPRKIEVDKSSNEGYDPNVSPTDCEDFSELTSNYGETLHMTLGLEDTLAVMLAVNVSVKLGGNPLWLYVVGPPSSGKSTLAECVAGSHPYCYSISKLTGVFSGFRAGSDASLLPRFQDRTVIIKDFTTLLSASQGEQERIFGELRDLYDGTASVHYRNKVQRTYNNIRFTILACTTDAIRSYNRTGLGERFLQIEIDSFWDETGKLQRHNVGNSAHIDRAITNIIQNVCRIDTVGTGNLTAQKCTTWGFLQHIHKLVESQPEAVAKVAAAVESDRKFKNQIIAMSQWVAYARSNVDRDRDKQLLYRPRVELGLRLASQLIKLAISLCLVFQLDKPDERVIRIVRKVGLDTATSFQLEIMLALAHSKDGRGMTREQIAAALNMTSTSIHNRLSDMRELGIIGYYKADNGSGQRGRNLMFFQLTPEMRKLATTLGFC